MTKYSFSGMSRKAVATANVLGILSEVENLASKFAKGAIKRGGQVSTDASVYVAQGLISAGADTYRVEFDGDFAGAEESIFNIKIYIKGYNGRYEMCRGIAHFKGNVAESRYAECVADHICDCFYKDLGMSAVWNSDSAELLDRIDETAEDIERELMQECVDRYQTECDGYVEDLKMVAEKYDDIESRFDALICAEILKKIAKLSDDCLMAVGDICGCEMVWDDMYHIDLTEIGKWYGGTPYTDIDSTDLENIINTLDYMSSTESDLPLGLDKDSIDWIVMGEGAAFLGMQPTYTGETAYNFVMQNV